jgi:hypothetical protein
MLNRRGALLIFIGLAIFGCPTKSGKKEPTRKACTAFGQQCELSQGKLGTCVIRDNCTDRNCLVCQSQH